MSQALLFYNGEFGRLLSEFEETKHMSTQEIYNQAVAKFMANGDSLLPTIKPLLEQMRAESSDEWPKQQSWSICRYHVALYHFYVGSLAECDEILASFWENKESVSDMIMLCVSLLTCELAIRTKTTQNVEFARQFIKTNFGDEEKSAAFLREKVSSEKWVLRVLQQIKHIHVRLEVNETLSRPCDDMKAAVEHMFESIDRSSSKVSAKLPVSLAIPIAQAALRLDEREKFLRILESADDQSHFVILNNRGIVELMHNRFASALLHFSKALSARNATVLVHPFQQVVYNVGISLLMKERPRDAFQFLRSVIPSMSQSPYLWLRLGECCVMFYKQRIAELRREKQKSPAIACELSTSRKTFIILPQTDYELFKRYAMEDEGDMNMDFALKCVRNSISLCTDKHLEPCLKSAQLLCSFVSLELGDGRRAFEMGRSVFTTPGIDAWRQFYAKIYTAQGYAIVGKPVEAQRVLSRLLIESNRELQDRNAALLHQTTFAKVSLAANDVVKARQQLGKIQECDAMRREVVLAHVALELRNKNMMRAVAAVRSCVTD